MKNILLCALIVVGYCFLGVPLARALSISVYVPEKYTVVEAGERLYFEIDIKYPENSKRKDLRLTYQIKKDGQLIAESKFLKAVETQASFMDFLVMPEGSKKGLYTINVVVSDYESLREEVSATFNVIASKQKEIQIYFFIILGVIILVTVLISAQIWIIRRSNS